MKKITAVECEEREINSLLRQYNSKYTVRQMHQGDYGDGMSLVVDIYPQEEDDEPLELSNLIGLHEWIHFLIQEKKIPICKKLIIRIT